MYNFDLHITVYRSGNEPQNWIIPDHKKSVQYYLKDIIIFSFLHAIDLLC